MANQGIITPTIVTTSDNRGREGSAIRAKFRNRGLYLRPEFSAELVREDSNVGVAPKFLWYFVPSRPSRTCGLYGSVVSRHGIQNFPSARAQHHGVSISKAPLSRSDTAMPGSTDKMNPRPDHGETSYKGSGKLQGKVAIITGGDSGIGRAVAIAFAREGANLLISYLNEERDAEEVKALVEQEGRRAVLVAGDIRDPGPLPFDG